MGPDPSALDTLKLLRSWTAAKRYPVLDEKKREVLFDDIVLKFSTQTAWYSKQKKKFYSIGTLVLLWKYSEGTGVSGYIRHSNSLQLPFVSTMEKYSLLRYLRGEIDTAPEIQVPPEEKVGGVGGKAPDTRVGVSSIGKPVTQATVLSAERVAAAKEKLAGVIRISGGSCNNAGLSSLLQEDQDLKTYLALDKSLVAEIRSEEVRVSDRNSTLRRPTKDFKFAWDYYMALRRIEKRVEGKPGNESPSDKRQRHDGFDRSHGLSQGRKSTGGKNVSRTATNVKCPIIIVPSTPNAMLTLYNIKEFLIDGGYISSTRKKAQDGNKPLEMKLERVPPNGGKITTEFTVIDNPRRLTDEDWNRVVCVVVQGAAWQFKEFKWKQPVNLFQHVLGIHIKYDDIVLESRVAGWNVQVVQISKDKRHLDKAASLEFWRLLDKFLHTSVKS